MNHSCISMLIFGILVIHLLYYAECLSRLRIIGGLQDDNQELKFAVAILRDNKLICTGSLIADQYVVTAGHCAVDKNTNAFIGGYYEIVAGTNIWDSSNGTHVQVEKIYAPTFYDPRNSNIADIAVFKIKKLLNISADARLFRLLLPQPIRSLGHADDFKGSIGVVAGYGLYDDFSYHVVSVNKQEKTFYTDGKGGTLQGGFAEVLSQADCNAAYSFKLHDSQLCARLGTNAVGHRGICNGDSGGPLVVENQLLGVVSFGSPECDDRFAPTVYTSVPYLIDFIVDAFNDNYSNNTIRSIN